MTELRFTVLDASRVPQARVHVVAYPQGDDLAGGVNPATITPAETYTDSAGRFLLNLIPSSLFDPPAPYVIAFAGHRHTIYIPDVGPVDLFSTPITPPAGAGFGAGPFGTSPFGGA